MHYLSKCTVLIVYVLGTFNTCARYRIGHVTFMPLHAHTQTYTIHLHRNRAIHGDTVVVRLLPRSEWKSRSNTLPHSPTDNDNTQSPNNQQGHSQLETMATGVVVGILHRASREYVASFDVSSESNLDHLCKEREYHLEFSYTYHVVCLILRLL